LYIFCTLLKFVSITRCAVLCETFCFNALLNTTRTYSSY